MVPELPPLPALTRAEGDLIDACLAVVDLLGRISPARSRDTYSGLRAAQALVARGAERRDALTVTHTRGESEVHTATLERVLRVLRVLDGERRTRLIRPAETLTGRGLKWPTRHPVCLVRTV